MQLFLAVQMPGSLTSLVVAMSTSASLTEENQISRSKYLVLRPLPPFCVLFWRFILNWIWSGSLIQRSLPHMPL